MSFPEGNVLFLTDTENQVDAEYANDLLDTLSERRDVGLLLSVIVAVDATVDAFQRNRENQDAQNRRTGWLVKEERRDFVAVKVAGHKQQAADA